MQIFIIVYSTFERQYFINFITLVETPNFEFKLYSFKIEIENTDHNELTSSGLYNERNVNE